MSQHYDGGEAGGGPFVRAPMHYYRPGTDLEAAGVHVDDVKPTQGLLTIGDPYNGAYALTGTPEELRKYVADLAALLGMHVVPDPLAVNEYSCHECGHIDQPYYQHLTSEHYRALDRPRRLAAEHGKGES
jgi:hypothetical protein